MVIPPGEKRELQMTLDLTARPLKGPDPLVRDFQVQITPARKEKESKGQMGKGWVVSGRVRKALRYEPPYLDFGKHSEYSQPVKGQEILVSAFAPVKNLEAKCSSPHFDVGVKKLDDDGKVYQVSVNPKPQVPIGSYKPELQINAFLDKGQKIKGREIPLRLEIADDIQTSPPQVHFGARTVGEMVEETMALTSLTQSPFQVLSFRVESPQGILEPKTLVPGEKGCHFQIQQKIVQLGEQAGEMIFSLQKRAGEKSELRIPIRYHGLAGK